MERLLSRKGLPLTRRWRIGLVLAGLLLLVAGYELRPLAVEVSVHPRRDLSMTYWRGALPLPEVADGSFFKQVLVNSYESPPLPFPERAPPYRVLFLMHLKVSEPGIHRFELDSSWNGALEIEGERVFGSGTVFRLTGRKGNVELSAGVHQARLFVQPAENPDTDIRLLWRPAGQTLRPISALDLSDPTSPRLYAFGARCSSPLIWAGALLLGLLTFEWILSVRDKDSFRRTILASLLLGAMALFARGAHFQTYPRAYMDEYHNAWAGWNLIHEGSPKSWSWLGVYKQKTWTKWFSYKYPIVEKTFDHPPLLPVLSGGVATLLGAENMFHCTLPRIRPLMVLAGVLSVILLFHVSREVTDFPTAFLAATILAVSPLAVFNSRLVKEDCLVQLFWLAALFAFLKRGDEEAPGLDLLCGAFCGLAALSKVPGVALGFAFAVAAIVHDPRDFRRPARILVTSLAIASLYPIYGLLVDPELSVAVLSYLFSHYPAESMLDKFLILPRLILQPRIAGPTPLIDGWILLGWLSVFYVLRNRPVVVSFAAYLLILMATLHSSWLWGFYMVPVLPYLCLAAAIHVRRTFANHDFLSVFLFVTLFFLPTSGALVAAQIAGGFRGLLLVACLPLLASLFRKREPQFLLAASRWMLGAMMILSILANIQRSLTTF